MGASGNNPSTDTLTATVEGCLEHYVHPYEHLLIGLSGGLDSTVLLHLLKKVSCRIGVTTSAIHVHHGLSQNADRWAQHCQNYCDTLGVALHLEKITVRSDTGEGMEGAARRLRRHALNNVRHDWLLFAHHQDDQAETLLMNLLRGAGVRGAAAMPERGGKIIRPLLHVPRQQLLAYAKQHDLNWIDDESNIDQRFTRNFIRHAVRPLLETRFPQAGKQLSAAARRFSGALILLEDLARIDLGPHSAKFPLPLSVFNEIDEPRAQNILGYLLSMNGLQSPDETRMCEFVRQLRSAGHDRHPLLEFSGHRLVSRRRFLHLETLPD